MVLSYERRMAIAAEHDLNMQKSTARGYCDAVNAWMKESHDHANRSMTRKDNITRIGACREITSQISIYAQSNE